MDSILTLKEMAQLLKMNERTVLKMAQTGAIPAAKIGSQWRFKRELVDHWLDDRMLGKAERATRLAAPDTTVLTPLPDMLDERLVKLDLEGSNKEEVLAQLVQLLVESHYLERADIFLRKLLEREKLMTTALGEGVAFPHPRQPQGSLFGRPKVVVGLSLRGVDYDALDGEPVHLFLLICAPDVSSQLRILAQLTRVIRCTDAVQQLLNAGLRQEVVELFGKWHRQLLTPPDSTGQKLQQ